LIIFNAKGRIVYLVENPEGPYFLFIRLNKGLYFARMEIGKCRTTEKVVVKEELPLKICKADSNEK